MDKKRRKYIQPRSRKVTIGRLMDDDSTNEETSLPIKNSSEPVDASLGQAKEFYLDDFDEDFWQYADSVATWK